MAEVIRTRGLAEFRSAIRKAPKEIKRRIPEANKAFADRVIDDARGLADTPIEVKSFDKGAVKSTKRARAAVIVLDRAKFGGVFGAELGALQWPQFDVWLGNQHSGFEWEQGYMVGTALRANLPEYEEAYLDLILDTLAPAFPD